MRTVEPSLYLPLAQRRWNSKCWPRPPHSRHLSLIFLTLLDPHPIARRRIFSSSIVSLTLSLHLPLYHYALRIPLSISLSISLPHLSRPLHLIVSPSICVSRILLYLDYIYLSFCWEREMEIIHLQTLLSDIDSVSRQLCKEIEGVKNVWCPDFSPLGAERIYLHAETKKYDISWQPGTSVARGHADHDVKVDPSWHRARDMLTLPNTVQRQRLSAKSVTLIFLFHTWHAHKNMPTTDYRQPGKNINGPRKTSARPSGDKRRRASERERERERASDPFRFPEYQTEPPVLLGEDAQQKNAFGPKKTSPFYAMKGNFRRKREGPTMFTKCRKQ